MRMRYSLLTGFATGVGLMFMFDPSSGRRRRALLRDKFVHARHVTAGTASGKAEYARDKAYGVYSETRSLFGRRRADDQTLEDRVRGELGRVTRHTGTIHVSALDGRVTLHGSVPAADLPRVVSAVESVKGVEKVDNRMHAQQRRSGPFVGEAAA